MSAELLLYGFIIGSLASLVFRGIIGIVRTRMPRE